MAVTESNRAGNSGAEEKFIQIFCDLFGPEKGQAIPDWEAIKEKERACIPDTIQKAKERALIKAEKDIQAHLERWKTE